MLNILFESGDGNSFLRNRTFPLAKGIRKHLENTLQTYNGDHASKGYKRLNNILSMENGIAYNEMKRLKHFFDNYEGNTNNDEYILNGGDEMKCWVTNTLNTAISTINNIKQAKKAEGLEVRRRNTSKGNLNRGLKPIKPQAPVKPKLPEQKKRQKTIVISEQQLTLLKG